MNLSAVKEEIDDNSEIKNCDNDYVVASRKVFAVSGFTPVLDSSKNYDISIRSDFKSLKITTELNRTRYVAYTKDAYSLPDEIGYAVKLSQEAGKAYLIPISAHQTAAFVDEKDRQTKSLEDHNDIVQDVSELPHPSRNKFNQLAVEMKHYLYKPLKVIPTHLERQYLNTFFSTSGKPQVVERDKIIPKHQPIVEISKPKIDLLKCDYDHMADVSFIEIKQIANEEMRAEAFMRKAQLATFYEIESILGIERSVLLNCLQTYAHLVHGNWVIKSSLLYKTSIYDDDVKKKHLEELTSLRESLLYCFVTNKRIFFRQKTPDHSNILDQLATRYGSNHELKFILPEDSFFLGQFSDIAPRHAAKTEVALRRYENYLLT